MHSLPTGQTGASTLASGYTGTISVTVTDDVGRTIEGALLKMVGNASSWVTNSVGVAVISGLLADTNGTDYTIWAEKTNYDPSPVAQVEVTPDNITDSVLAISGGVIYGQVSDMNGPVHGAIVSISALGYSNTTDSDGLYNLYGVPGGTHSATASAVGYVNQTEDVALETGGVTALFFVLVSKTGEITGSVHAQTGEELGDANVSVKVGTVTVTVTSNLDGSYTVPSLPAGTYDLTASLAGFNSTTVSGIIVTAGTVTENVDFELVEKPTRLYGTVRAGTALKWGVHIEVVGTNLSANTTAEGEYEIKNIPAGTYSLYVTLLGYYSVTVAGVIIPRGSEVRQDITLVGMPGGMRGTVVEKDTLEPLLGVSVMIIDEQSNQRETKTDPNGVFEFTGVASGNYTVRFSLDGYRPIELGSIAVSGDEQTNLTQISMEPTKEGFGGFIFGFDLAHSMMILALFLTIVILALAVILRIRTLEAPDKAPAVYDQEEPSEGEGPPGEGRTGKPPPEDGKEERRGG